MTIVLKVKKKPLIIEAVQFTGDLDNYDFLVEWSNNQVFVSTKDSMKLYVETLEGQVHTTVGSYIVKGAVGEVWPIRKDIFEETYEILKDEV